MFILHFSRSRGVLDYLSAWGIYVAVVCDRFTKVKTDIYISENDTWEVNNKISKLGASHNTDTVLNSYRMTENSFVIRSFFYCLSNSENTKVISSYLSSAL